MQPDLHCELGIVWTGYTSHGERTRLVEHMPPGMHEHTCGYPEQQRARHAAGTARSSWIDVGETGLVLPP